MATTPSSASTKRFTGAAPGQTKAPSPATRVGPTNTDPVGAFDSNGNFYEFVLAYQFFYNTDDSHNLNIGTPHEPNPAEPAEVVSVAVRPHGATAANQWIRTHNGQPDFVATYDSIGNEPHN